MYDEFINIFGDIENLYSSNFLINHEKLHTIHTNYFVNV